MVAVDRLNIGSDPAGQVISGNERAVMAAG